MRKLLKNKPLIVSLAILFLIFCALIVAWLGSLYTLNRLSFKYVTTTQLAAAMRQDEFWSNYRFNTLVFDGNVKSIRLNDGKTTLDLVTADTYGTSCEITYTTNTFKVGETYKFEAETYQAERQQHGVLLHNCINQ